MTEEPNYYRLPEHHESQVRRMVIGLALFFAVLAVFVTLFVLNARQIAQRLPFSVEQRFIRPYELIAEQIQKRREPPAGAAEMERYLQSLSESLGRALDLPADYVLTVHYVNSDTVNAFATLGGHIFVLRGLLAEMPDENSLAMVLAHEIAHVKHRDPVVSLGRGLALQMILSFLTGDYTRSSDVLGAGGSLGLMYFSREQEQLADVSALSALQRHYGHVAGADEVFRILERSQEPQQQKLPGWLSSHPATEDRIEALHRYAAERQWPQGEVRAIPEAIRDIASDCEELALCENEESA